MSMSASVFAFCRELAMALVTCKASAIPVGCPASKKGGAGLQGELLRVQRHGKYKAQRLVPECHIDVGTILAMHSIGAPR